jgi:ABC-type spermidine/putrescine transport system permease subunit II
MSVQLAVYDQVTGNVIPMTNVIPLSETNPRTLSMSVPAEFSRWYQTVDNSAALWSIVIYNPTSVATVTTSVATITSDFDLSLNEAVAQ